MRIGFLFYLTACDVEGLTKSNSRDVSIFIYISNMFGDC